MNVTNDQSATTTESTQESLLTTGAETPAPEAAPVDPSASLLTGIVDANGRQKYNDVNSALQGLQHSQQHIGTLEAENRQLRSQLEATTKTMEQLQTMQANLEETVKSLTNAPVTGQTNATLPDVNDIVGQVRQSLQAEEQAKVAQQRVQEAEEFVRQAAGANAQAMLQQYAAQYAGSNLNQVVETIKASPQLFKDSFTSFVNSQSTDAPVNMPGVSAASTPATQVPKPVMPTGAASPADWERYRVACTEYRKQNTNR